MIEKEVSDKNDLGPKGNGFGLKGLGSEKPQLLTQILQEYLAALDDAFKGLPGIKMSQEIQGPNNKEPSIGPVEASGPKHGEIRDQGSPLGFTLDGPEQSGIGGVGFKDHRSPLKAGIIHKQVDLVTLKEGLPRGNRHREGRMRRLLPGSLTEFIQMLQNVSGHRPQIFLNRGQGRIFM